MKEWIKDIALAIVIALVVIQFVKPTIVKQSSMEPNFHENDYLFVSKQSYKLFGEPKRGDVVVVHSALTQDNGNEKMLIKRIIALPGEQVDIADEKVYINGEEMSQDFTNDGVTNGDVRGLIVPEGELFCMGDNRLVSTDSRDPRVGCVPIENVVGKVVLRLFPFDQFGLIENPLE